jgi:beta-xylosidase
MEKSIGTIKTKKWGDLGNGYFKNPVLNADFSDPDVIRVGSDFFMVCSDFHFMGMPVLHSKDLVNWKIVGKVYDRLDIDPRYDNCLYYVYFCTPDEGLFMSTASDPAGLWSPLVEVKRIGWWEDPCPFWDDDGKAYLGHSIVGAGPIIIHEMSPDGKTLLDEGKTVYIGKIAEGTKFYKRKDYYYLVIPEGGVETGYQTVLRSRSIYGPYERKVTLSQGKTGINGPHQGALVELESGETWFMHFQSNGTIGRVCHLQPVKWIDDWPVMGNDGEPVMICKKPSVENDAGMFYPQTSDDFNDGKLCLQWQWNHNPVDENWSLSARPGFLRIISMPADGLNKARNVLTQKLIGEKGTIVVKLDVSSMKNGQIAGISYPGNDQNWIGVVKKTDEVYLKSVTSGVSHNGSVIFGNMIYLRTDYDLASNTFFSFGFDEKEFIPLGGNCTLKSAYWKGARIGLMTYHEKDMDGGIADFDYFYYKIDN